MRFDGAVDHRQVLAVVQGVKHGDFQRGTQGDRRFARLQIHLHAVFFGESFQARAEGIDRIALACEVNAAAKADPLDLGDQVAETLFDGGQHLVEQLEAAVLAVVVEHEAGNLPHDLLDLRWVPLAEAAERTRRVGQQVVGAAHLRVDAQAADGALGTLGEAFELTNGVEDDLVAVGDHLFDLVVGPGHAVGVGFAGELLPAQFQLIQRRRRGAVHILLHQVEHRPGGEAFQRQQRLGTGVLTHVGDLLQVDQKLLFVDEVVRRLDHLVAPARSASGGVSAPRKKVDANCADNRRISKGHWGFFVQPVMTRVCLD